LSKFKPGGPKMLTEKQKLGAALKELEAEERRRIDAKIERGETIRAER
jgi:hypothetical protein